MKKILLSLFIIPSLFSMDMQHIHDHNIMKLNGTKDAQLYHDSDGFQINDHGQFKRIPSHRLTQAVRKLKDNPEAMDHFLKNKGYLKLTQNEEGEPALDVDGRIIGGGILVGQIAGWTVRGLGYSTYAVACFFQPHLLVEAPLVHEAIEASALAATAIGTATPTT